MHRLADWRVKYVRDGRQAWAAALALLFPLLSLVTGFGIGLAGFLFLATALCWWRAGWRLLRMHWPRTRWVLLAFLVHFALLALLAIVRGRSGGMLDAPARMCLMAAAMLVVQVARPPLRALWLGTAGGALGGLGFVAWQRFALGWERPGGWMNPITFGDLSLCLALLALVGVANAGTPLLRRIGMAGVATGLGASLLTGSRGGWLVLPLMVVLVAGRHALLPRRLALGWLLAACALAALAWLAPQTGVRARIDAGIGDVRLALAGDPAPTSLGVRLALWKAGWMLAREHPWTGLDTPAYKARMRVWVVQGRLSGAVFAPPEPPHLHNDALQALVTRGVPGLLAWSATLLAPLVFFAGRLRRARRGGAQRAAAVAGLLLVLAYASFGLTEVIFWSMKANLFYALMVFLLMGWCLSTEHLHPVPDEADAARARRPGTRVVMGGAHGR